MFIFQKNKSEFHDKISDSNVLVIKATTEGTRRVLLVALKQSPVCVRDAMSGLLMRNMDTTFLPSVYTILLDRNLVYCGTSKHDILVHNFHVSSVFFVIHGYSRFRIWNFYFVIIYFIVILICAVIKVLLEVLSKLTFKV